MRRRLRLWLPALALVALAASEAAARFGLGLGDPPLYEASEAYEYRLKPDQRVQRFGHLLSTNHLGLRSADVPSRRHPSRRRLLVIGDSIVWGGSQLDQRLIATELIRRQTGDEVPNVAAPSWGPANQRAFLQKHGLLEATDVVLVISSHDAFDVPTFEPLSASPDKPTEKPFSALIEAGQRYLLPRLMPWRPAAVQSVQQSSALDDLDALLTDLSAAGVRIGVVQFWERDEVRAMQPYSGHAQIARVLQRHGLQPVQSAAVFRSCGTLDDLYIDHIHPYTAAGQACLARAILQAVQGPAS